MKVKSLKSCPTLCDPWTAAYQAPLSMGFSRQEYWSGVPSPSPMENSIEVPQKDLSSLEINTFIARSVTIKHLLHFHLSKVYL